MAERPTGHGHPTVGDQIVQKTTDKSPKPAVPVHVSGLAILRRRPGRPEGIPSDGEATNRTEPKERSVRDATVPVPEGERVPTATFAAPYRPASGPSRTLKNPSMTAVSGIRVREGANMSPCEAAPTAPNRSGTASTSRT
jgi:hypothetical protein